MRLCQCTSMTVAIVMGSSIQAGMVEWTESQGGNGHFYEGVHSASAVTWESAQSLAVDRGGYLVTLTSAAENAFVLSLVDDTSAFWQNSYGGPWLGAYQPDPIGAPSEGWVWVTGETWGYTNWAANEPGDQGWQGGVESYLQFVNLSGKWNDFTNDGNATYSYIVEYTPAPGALAIGALFGLFRRRRRGDPWTPRVESVSVVSEEFDRVCHFRAAGEKS